MSATGLPRKKSWNAFQVQLLLTKDQATKQRKYPCGICNKSVSWKQKGLDVKTLTVNNGTM